MSTATIAELVTELVSKAPVKTEVRRIQKMEFGQTVRQGDIYVTKINPNKTQLTLKNDVKVDLNQYISPGLDQLVPGNTTGSHHCVAQNQYVKVWNNPQTSSNSLIGPVIEAKETFCITHPKHAHMELPEGTYLVTYQLNALTRQRVKD